MTHAAGALTSAGAGAPTKLADKWTPAGIAAFVALGVVSLVRGSRGPFKNGA